ncbi:uncharacterized protein Tco025E_03574 [Trypanosoma conorhini]|uniref:Saposin B-type domain-containing protein n=1 Tax=Trypanosoma conorhini TaxID=83891 RepID=A0A422PSY9_9TRYP|nr:uncharacterized protein Tco025E_03574 [Trypanosoma conorhini]RNF20844.1 hypothetical protein Tco025E_03574 [Trypanosoma conorhini]
MRTFVVSLFILVTLLLSSAIDARKEKPLHDAFPKEVIDGIRCGVCNFAVKQAYGNVLGLFNASIQTRVRMNEEDVLTVLEDICNPFTEVGQWIRRITITHRRDTDHLLGVEELPVYTKCKRTCSTVVEACEAVMDHESMDTLSPRLLHLTEYADAGTFAQALCGPSPICTKRRRLLADRYDELVTMMDADPMEEIDPKEMEVERMMDHMERKENRRQTIFSREEITKMQEAFLRGDKEAVAKVDPSIMDLSEDEFAAVQAMMRGRKDGKPQAGETDADGEAKVRRTQRRKRRESGGGEDDWEDVGTGESDL